MLEIQTILQKKLQTAIVVNDYCKWRNDINSASRWKLVKSWPQYQFAKQFVYIALL